MKLLETQDYLLLIDEEAEIAKLPYFLWKNEIHKFHSDNGYGIKTWTDYNNEDGSSVIVNYSNKHKGSIIAYYPLTEEAKELDLPLLPNPFEVVDVEELAKRVFKEKTERIPVPTSFWLNEVKNYEAFWIEGYKAAQSKQFSLEDIKEALKQFAVEAGSINGAIDVSSPASAIKWVNHYIQSLSTQQLPSEFIPEYTWEWFDSVNDTGWENISPSDMDAIIAHGLEPQPKFRKRLKTITNSEGKQELVGIYRY